MYYIDKYSKETGLRLHAIVREDNTVIKATCKLEDLPESFDHKRPLTQQEKDGIWEM
ncbi:hypothetical protein LRP52_37140 [Photobacterium sp. ZSDE20]|uniref:Uncharacterized protein n=1 Tax=Photobacterium pectinilyticum TaxID=2906793 RepID=A0ABT1N794_9GAMM|nr:hypothetical protein [Photobacterium sp. ZSDE20]MCQ1060618.1 hypothetical protein [Photobacterium sp. ZSDE20]MDD1827813.1 hypothetical protein [Photobacterium sp. ZSDE20]